MNIAVVALGALIASGVQATTGLGFALILTPILFAVMRPTDAIITATALGLLLNLLVLFAEPRRAVVAWGDVLPILAAAVPGSVCGILILQNVAKPALQIAIGVAVIAATAQSLMRRRYVPEVSTAHPSSIWTRLSLGLATGILTTSTGVSGPPLALWLSERGLSPGELRDSITVLFLGIGLIAAITLLPLLRRAHIDTVAVAVAAGSVLVGHAVGSRLFARLTSTRFLQATLAITLAAGTASFVLGLRAV